MRNMTNTLKSISGHGLAIHGRLVMNVDSLDPHTSDLECCRWAGSCVLSAVLNLLRRNNKEHSGRIMAVVRLYIENIQNLENISAVIEKLGKIGA